MIVSKDIDTIIWRFIHNSNMKSLNTEYLQSVYKDCDRFPDQYITHNTCNHCIFYRELDYNYRSWKTGMIHDLIGRNISSLPDNY